MFSFSEIFLVFLLVVILLGPRELPKLAEYAGRMVKKWRQINQLINSAIQQQKKYQQLIDNEARAAIVDKIRAENDPENSVKK